MSYTVDFNIVVTDQTNALAVYGFLSDALFEMINSHEFKIKDSSLSMMEEE